MTNDMKRAAFAGFVAGLFAAALIGVAFSFVR
jgi:hypothetical protein